MYENEGAKYDGGCELANARSGAKKLVPPPCMHMISDLPQTKRLVQNRELSREKMYIKFKKKTLKQGYTQGKGVYVVSDLRIHPICVLRF